jgi:hypothetical protein
MNKKLAFLASLAFLLSSHFITAQEYIGTWALDWSGDYHKGKQKTTKVADSLHSANLRSEKNPVWVFAEDSLKIYQNGALISTAEIKWTRSDQFEIIDDNKKKNLTYFIDDIDEEKIKMRTGYSDAEIYLRKLN